ncbi:MAG: PQQ-binding-like beta-propeller repeat protein [Candidatus Hydrogenedentes bacterium]|nr:PQQ-binding-like beta-propeller repeat protein [Candidatus Hydrogenedentota bacterium]
MQFRFGFLLLAGAVLAALLPSAARAEWPTYRHDLQRTGVAPEPLPQGLKETWRFTAKHAPEPAWPGPARRDGWHKSDPLKPRMIFDWAFHITESGGKLYFGSSADDKLYCLDAATGEERWSFFAEGPIRLAPTLYQGKAYFGADDGYVYCLNAETGEEIWRHKAAPEDYRLPGNARIMSIYPVRTGVLVDNDIAYFCGGIFTFEGAYVCAVDANTGKALWKKKLRDSAQGYMLASADKLYVARGRVNPIVLQRADGAFLYAHDGAGGSFTVLVDDYLFYGPGKTGQIEAARSDRNDNLVTFQGNQIVVNQGRAFMQTDTEMSALDRTRYLKLAEEKNVLSDEHDQLKEKLKELKKAEAPTDAQKAEIDTLVARMEELSRAMLPYDKQMQECLQWKVPCKYPYSLIMAGEQLFCGGMDGVAAIQAADGATAWEAPVDGRALELAISNQSLFVSTDKGIIHCFSATAK